MAAEFVVPFRKGGKNDAADAEAVAIASRQSFPRNKAVCKDAVRSLSCFALQRFLEISCNRLQVHRHVAMPARAGTAFYSILTICGSPCNTIGR